MIRATGPRRLLRSGLASCRPKIWPPERPVACLITALQLIANADKMAVLALARGGLATIGAAVAAVGLVNVIGTPEALGEQPLVTRGRMVKSPISRQAPGEGIDFEHAIPMPLAESTFRPASQAEAMLKAPAAGAKPWSRVGAPGNIGRDLSCWCRRSKFHWQYVPSYNNGIAPYGVSTAKSAIVLPAYFEETGPCAQAGVKPGRRGHHNAQSTERHWHLRWHIHRMVWY
jgi:hypothetical protein